MIRSAPSLSGPRRSTGGVNNFLTNEFWSGPQGKLILPGWSYLRVSHSTHFPTNGSQVRVGELITEDDLLINLSLPMPTLHFLASEAPNTAY